MAGHTVADESAAEAVGFSGTSRTSTRGIAGGFDRVMMPIFFSSGSGSP
jgi:hypothetical protein